MVMEQVLIAFTLVTGVIGMITFVATSVWAVAQVKETTSNLAIKIETLSHTIEKMDVKFEAFDRRLVQIERKH